MTHPLIEVQNLWVQYNHAFVLENVNLTIHSQDFLVIIGPNGGGKTTLLKAILGLIKPYRGRIQFLGKEQSVRHQMGYVPQVNLSDREFPIRVWDVVLMGRVMGNALFKPFRQVDFDSADQALAAVNMLDFKTRQIGQLSEGQRQRVFIARALASHPQVLLLDEPVSSADHSSEESFYELLKNLQKKTAIVMVSHDIMAVSKYANQIACLNKKLFYHDGESEFDTQTIEKTYGCHIDLIAHGHPHRVFRKHPS